MLSGVGSGGAKKGETSLPTTADFQRAPASARSRLFNDRDKQATGAPASAGWSSNRWRHLQADEDSHISSSGSSTKDENEENDVWTRPTDGSDSQWRPGHHDAIEREKQAMQRGQAAQAAGLRNGQDVLAQPSWRRNSPPAGQQALPGQADQSTSEALAPSTQANPSGNDHIRPQLPTSTSNQSLFFDDLLGPTRQQNQPTSVSSSRSNSIAQSMGNLNIGNNSNFRTSANSTPTRASAAEGLELLARRSPVQEMSMAALQQQHPLHTPPANGPHHYRPSLPPHPTTEPADRIFWQYRDPQGQLQGPFSVIQMQEWYGQGFFSDTLLVKRVESTDYETLGALIIRLHDVHLPFFSAPLIHHSYVAPPGMQAPGLGHPPYHRMASPVTWQQQQQQSSPIPEQAQQLQPPEQHRNASFSAGNAVFDLFSKAQQPQSHSPEAIVSPLPPVQQPAEPLKAPQAVSAPVHDPWADMTPAAATKGASIPRGSSALGGEPVEVEGALFRQSAPGQHLSSVPANAVRNDSLPAPIGRTPSMSVPKTAASQPAQQVSSPVKKDSAQPPVIEPAVSQTAKPSDVQAAKKEQSPVTESSLAAAPKSAVSKVNQAKSVSPAIIHKAALSVTPASVNTEAKSAQAPKPLQTGSKGDGVSVVSQESFDKQKKGPAASSNASELPLAPAVSPPLGTPTTAARKAAPWAKSLDDKSGNAEPGLSKSTSGMSLLEIQAKEQKEAEARRAQEKKALAAQRAAEEAALAEKRAREAAEGLPMTARWGDSAVSSPSASAPITAPWAKIAPASGAASKGTKKTLKEIQEEEEARRLAAQQAQAQKVSKAYANTIAHAAAPSADSPWQTVGASKAATSSPAPTAAVRPPGMNGPSSVPAHARPVMQQGYSMASKLSGQAPKPATPVAAPATVRTLSAAASNSPAAAVAAASSSASKDDEPAFPASSDLLKWCKDALKGLEIPGELGLSHLSVSCDVI